MSDNALPPYSGEMACCEACDSSEADTAFMPKLRTSQPNRLDAEGQQWPRDRFLKRTCLCCGFEWAEACVDRDSADYKRQGGPFRLIPNCNLCSDTGRIPNDHGLSVICPYCETEPV